MGIILGHSDILNFDCIRGHVGNIVFNPHRLLTIIDITHVCIAQMQFVIIVRYISIICDPVYAGLISEPNGRKERRTIRTEVIEYYFFHALGVSDEARTVLWD